MTPSTDNIEPVDNYLAHWLFFLTLLGMGAYWCWNHYTTIMPAPELSAPVVPNLQTFLILHLPEVPLQETASEYTRGKMDSWLNRLLQENYQPMLLSDVEQRLLRHEGLPERAIVLTFDPGYRHTYEVAGPLLIKYRTPAVWITHSNTRGIVDRRYLNDHALAEMKRSGFWDVGIYYEGHLDLESNAINLKTVGDGKSVWRLNGGRNALNMGLGITGLNRLNVSSLWTDEELMNRLAAEMPIQGSSFLSTRTIQHHAWGVTMTHVTSDLARFNLRAAANRHTAELNWTGVHGIHDARFVIHAKRVVGELWLSTRVMDLHGDAVHVGFTPNGTFIDEEVNHHRQRIATGPAPDSLAPFSASVVLDHSKLTVLVDGAQPLEVRTLQDAHGQGNVRLTVYDHVNGAAHADWVTLQVTLT